MSYSKSTPTRNLHGLNNHDQSATMLSSESFPISTLSSEEIACVNYVNKGRKAAPAKALNVKWYIVWAGARFLVQKAGQTYLGEWGLVLLGESGESSFVLLSESSTKRTLTPPLLHLLYYSTPTWPIFLMGARTWDDSKHSCIWSFLYQLQFIEMFYLFSLFAESPSIVDF